MEREKKIQLGTFQAKVQITTQELDYISQAIVEEKHRLQHKSQQPLDHLQDENKALEVKI